jgi:hypothetical protein
MSIVLPRTDNTMVKRKRTNNDIQNTTLKIKDRATRTTLKPVKSFENFYWYYVMYLLLIVYRDETGARKQNNTTVSSSFHCQPLLLIL